MGATFTFAQHVTTYPQGVFTSRQKGWRPCGEDARWPMRRNILMRNSWQYSIKIIYEHIKDASYRLNSFPG